MPRTNKIIIRSGTAAPSAGDFVAGEPAWDATNGKFYIKNSAGTMVEITGAGGGGSSGVVEAATASAFPATGAASTIYIDRSTNRLYRWASEGAYAEIGSLDSDSSNWTLLYPTAPTGVTGTAGNNQVALTWTAPSYTGTPITDYLVQYSSNSGSTWTTFSDGTSTAASATVTGLSNGTAYTFRVAAVNGLGTSSYSTASASVTPAAWSPANLTPTLWLDASVSSSLYDATSGGSLVGSGGTVRRWEDLSGNGNHATGSTGPTRSVAAINGKDALAFSSQQLQRTSLNVSGTDFSLFAVIKYATSGEQLGVGLATSSNVSGLSLYSNRSGASGVYSAAFGSSSALSESLASGGTADNTTRAFGALLTGGTGTLYLNNTSSGTTSRANVLSTGGLIVGGYFGARYLSGSICEIVYVTRAITASERTSLQSYFASKWGV